MMAEHGQLSDRRGITEASGGVGTLTRKDFVSDQEVRWCPGCGDYAILAAVQGVMPELGIPREKIVFVSGHRLLQPLPVLHEHVRRPRDPRARAGDRDGYRHRAARPPGVGRHRRRRRALDRRQPPDPRASPQRQPQDPAVQQPDLRTDEGPVLADVRAGEGHEVDAVRLARAPLQPDLGRARVRGDVRRSHASTSSGSTCPRS